MDRANALLEEEFPTALKAFLPRVEAAKARLQAAGYGLVGGEPLKLSLATKTYGWEGSDLAEALEQRGSTANSPTRITPSLCSAPWGARRIWSI